MNQPQSDNQPSGIAVIGMAGRFPGAADAHEFWRNLSEGVCSIAPIPATERPSELPQQANHVSLESTIDDAEFFDAKFFGIYPKQARDMDPQHRVFLECAWSAMEDAGYLPDEAPGDVGVFAGCHMNTYVLTRMAADARLRGGLADSFPGGNLVTEISSDKDYLATRVSFQLNLTGPSIAVQTACSTSLVAIAQACESLAAGSCEMALAGGATITFPRHAGYLFTEDSILAPDGVCRTFDVNAKGTVFGDGVGVVLLKPVEKAIEDGDEIYAVIRGWGVSNDGRDKQGYTAPSIKGQASAILRAHRKANITADTISYVEAHGTATQVGDPIEIEALTRAFRESTDKKQFCRIGSLKTNVGHLDVAAGVAGLMKACLALKHAKIPPSLNYTAPNPRIDFENSPFEVNTTLTPWETNGHPRRAGLSAFGVGGTNAHLIIDEPPATTLQANERTENVITLSARSETALDKQCQELASHLKERPELALDDVCHTLQTGRKKFNYSRIITVSSIGDAVAALESLDSERAQTLKQIRRRSELVWMFPGQGSQHINMARELYETEPEFAAPVNECAELLQETLKLDIRDLMFDGSATASTETINQTAVAQPAMFVISYAMAVWLQARGVSPTQLIGHSVGEFAAACLAGIFTLPEALKLVATRGRLMQDLPSGSMLSIRLPANEVKPLLPSDGRVEIAAINSPATCVVAGPTDAIEAFATDLEAGSLGVSPPHRLLQTSHAFHSAMMDPAVEQFAAVVKTINLKPPAIPLISTVTASLMTAEEATSVEYWSTQIRRPVRFADALGVALESPDALLLEVGPGQALTTLSHQHRAKTKDQLAIASLPHPRQEQSAATFALTALGRLWQANIAVDWTSLYQHGSRPKVHLPTYPFERELYRYEIDDDEGETNSDEDFDFASKEAADAQTKPIQRQTLGAANSPAQQLVQQQLEIMNQQLQVWNSRQSGASQQ